jgi:putative transposase
MYSYEERMRPVEVYIKLGKRVRATIRELGSPTKTALKGWHREYERQQDLPTRSVSRPPKFSEIQKPLALECQRQSKSEPKGSAKCCHFGVGEIAG